MSFIGRDCCPTTGRPTSRPSWRNGWDERNIGHVRGAPCHPQTQGKIERWHQTLKNRILLENYYFPGDLEAKIAAFVERGDNHRRYHESLNNLTPADVYSGRGPKILMHREKDQTRHNPESTLATPNDRRINSTIR